MLAAAGLREPYLLVLVLRPTRKCLRLAIIQIVMAEASASITVVVKPTASGEKLNVLVDPEISVLELKEEVRELPAFKQLSNSTPDAWLCRWRRRIRFLLPNKD